jgi:hypothetical protein
MSANTTLSISLDAAKEFLEKKIPQQTDYVMQIVLKGFLNSSSFEQMEELLDFYLRDHCYNASIGSGRDDDILLNI